MASLEPRDMLCHDPCGCYNIRIHAVQSARDTILCNITEIDYSRLVLLIVGVGFFVH